MTGLGITWARCRRWYRWPLMIWVLLPLLGCGGTLFADDAETAAIVERGKQLYAQKDFAAARDKANLAVRRESDSAPAVYLRGLASVQLKDYAAAREDLERARQLDPMLSFADDEQAFQTALRTARDNTVEALGGEIETPPAPHAKPEAEGEASDLPAVSDSEPAAPEATKPAQPDPKIAALTATQVVIEDWSEADLLAEPQVRAMRQAAESLAARGLAPKLVVLAQGADAAAEARRWYDVADLPGEALLVVGVPPATVAIYAPSLDPAETARQVDEATAKLAADASLARRMIVAAAAVGGRMEIPPALPAESAAPAPATEPAVPAPVPPPARYPLALLIPAGAAGLLGLALLWLLLGRFLARRRLTRGFTLAAPRLVATADRLTETLRRLLSQRDRQAAAAHAAAELAFLEANGMMAAAAEDNTRDIARVERANRLLAEADAKLDEAGAALGPDPGEPGTATFYCYFTARPLADRSDGDLVRLAVGGESRDVLVARPVGDRIRRGEVPGIRTIEAAGQTLHWARLGGFDPTYDLYHADRFGWHFTAPSELGEVFFDDGAWPIFVETGDRPDYRLDLDQG